MARTFDEANAVQRTLRRFVASGPGSRVARPLLHRLDLLGARLLPSSPRPVSAVLAGVPVGFVTTTGARSGHPRTVPLILVPLDQGWGVVASAYGAARAPAWYHNLGADPRATVQLDGAVHVVRAERLTGVERERLRTAALTYYPGYAAYEQRAGGRDLGFFRLRREDD